MADTARCAHGISVFRLCESCIAEKVIAENAAPVSDLLVETTPAPTLCECGHAVKDHGAFFGGWTGEPSTCRECSCSRTPHIAPRSGIIGTTPAPQHFAGLPAHHQHFAGTPPVAASPGVGHEPPTPIAELRALATEEAEYTDANVRLCQLARDAADEIERLTILLNDMFGIEDEVVEAQEELNRVSGLLIDAFGETACDSVSKHLAEVIASLSAARVSPQRERGE